MRFFDLIKEEIADIHGKPKKDKHGNVKPMVDTDPKHFLGKNATGPQDQLSNDKDFVSKAVKGTTELDKDLHKTPEELAQKMFKTEKPMPAGTEMPSVFNSPKIK